ncbi:SCO1664 family protein [Arthrobacter sp. zg-ZUI100]|uniref:SCO1664 family protein n=1 Tax=Arthrobacter jiangjiafuii TaxID=2817475 RepID=UPI001AEE8FB4|nr:SCO1664 family protein [Arthrobacter jiangjiafuii]MBP3037556.1 SCO1664 family protein [Arthrobacter jiangjiafuii]
MPAPDLVTAELTLTGRITTASNATFLGSIGDAAVVYKPIAGEQPLWDFPDGCLAHREVAAYLVSEVLGWNIVPRTWLRDGPFGEGMVQLWQETDPEQTAVDLVPADDVPESGWKQVLEGEDQNGRAVALIHEDTPPLRRMAVFDVLVNNADRKGDHILAMGDGHRYGVDHGLTFNSDHKLRTVLWGWIGEALSAEELEGIDHVLSGLEGELGRNLDKLLTPEEFATLAVRCARLRRAGQFPAPSGGMPAVPWPLF